MVPIAGSLIAWGVLVYNVGRFVLAVWRAGRLALEVWRERRDGW